MDLIQKPCREDAVDANRVASPPHSKSDVSLAPLIVWLK